MSKSKKLPPDIADHWPEVFNEIEINVVPVEYLDSIKVSFTDGKIWDIDIKKSREKDKLDIELALEDLFFQYEDVIENIDFRVDTERVKKDIQQRTRYFLKKRK